MKFHRPRRACALFLAIFLFACAASAGSSAYRQSVEKWRHDYEDQLTSDSGWLSVSGLFWLHEGENCFGSDPLNDIVLPTAAPAQAGTFDFHAGKTTVRIHPGVAATINSKRVESAELRPDNRDDRLVLGDLTLYVHASGDRFALRLKDRHSPLLKSFTGLQWFPVDESLALSARFIPYDSPKQFDSQNVLGDSIKMDIVGYVLFTLRGQEYRLEAEANPDGTLFIVFRDLTSGKETYPASRFLDTDLPKDGPPGETVQLDFNKAYNPPCAYNPYTTCPIPLPANRLRVEIRAGEKLYKHPHAPEPEELPPITVIRSKPLSAENLVLFEQQQQQ
ncbi:MAG: DUF1684 domain-containing protein [Candidatus Acidiferrales bacterium]